MVATENKHIMSKIDTSKHCMKYVCKYQKKQLQETGWASGNSRIKAGSWFSLLLYYFSIVWFFFKHVNILFQWKIRIMFFKKEKTIQTKMAHGRKIQFLNVCQEYKWKIQLSWAAAVLFTIFIFHINQQLSFKLFYCSYL